MEIRKEILAPLLLACCFLALFGLAEWLYHRRRVKAEWTRKLVHAGTGIITLLFPVWLNSHWQVLFLCGSFLLILLASLRFRMLPSINAIDRFSVGSILYPVAVYGCFLVFQFAQRGLIVFYLPVLILAICDPVAAFAGKRFPFGAYRIAGCRKTCMGSGAFLISALLLTAGMVYAFGESRPVLQSHPGLLALVPLCATFSEAIGVKGWDNLTIPASVVLTLIFVL